MTGKIIFINGASSAGKSTLCQALQARLPEPFWHISIDHLRAAGLLPTARIASGEFDWHAMRPAFFEGFHRCLPALAQAGNHLLVEHIIETPQWRDRLLELLAPFDVFFVGLHCPLPLLEQRELQRGDRRIGEARADFATIHALVEYDLELDSSADVGQNAEFLIDAWRARSPNGAFGRMRKVYLAGA
jgi:chloramphenicol 3-O phosphotransferase